MTANLSFSQLSNENASICQYTIYQPSLDSEFPWIGVFPIKFMIWLPCTFIVFNRNLNFSNFLVPKNVPHSNYPNNRDFCCDYWTHSWSTIRGREVWWVAGVASISTISVQRHLRRNQLFLSPIIKYFYHWSSNIFITVHFFHMS